MPVEISGLEELEDNLRNLEERIESLGGEVPISDLFTSNFMQEYTDFATFEEFLEASEWDVDSQADFENIPEKEFDRYVDEHTGFDSWETMLSVAGREYVMRNINEEL